MARYKIGSTGSLFNFGGGSSGEVIGSLSSDEILGIAGLYNTAQKQIQDSVDIGTTTVYTCPSNTRTVVQKISLYNTDPLTATAHVYLGDIITDYRILYNLSIGLASLSISTTSFVMQAGDTLKINTNRNGLRCNILIHEFSDSMANIELVRYAKQRFVSESLDATTVASGKDLVLTSGILNNSSGLSGVSITVEISDGLTYPIYRGSAMGSVVVVNTARSIVTENQTLRATSATTNVGYVISGYLINKAT